MPSSARVWLARRRPTDCGSKAFTGRIVLIGEDERSYERPALSKSYLLGKEERASIYVHEEHRYAEHGVELLLGRRVTVLDRVAQEVELDTEERIGYAKMLLATGDR
jgi:3-phenylpropionate/trans-cinnamate dioxygenase ferredoxin reductase component